MNRYIAPVREYVADVVRSLGFLSRFNLSARWFEGFDGQYTVAARGFPAAGLLVTLPAAVVAATLASLGLPAPLSAVLGVAALIASTGALHEDGLADSFDGLGRSTAEERLQAMRDHALGVFGATALLLVTIARLACVTILSASPIGVVIGWSLSAAVGRGAMVYLWSSSTAASASGAAYSAGRPNARAMRFGMVSCAVIALPTLWWFGPWALVLATALCAGTVRLVRKTFVDPIGGHTGDILGATATLCETVTLLSLAAFL